MSYCHVHGRYGDYEDGCPQCRTAEERADQDHTEIRQQLAQLSYDARNPGDYTCPHCRYVALRQGATRCPLCHGTIDAQFWRDVAARKQAAAKAAHDERLRRERIEREEYERARPERERLHRRKRLLIACGIFFAYFLPVLSTATVMLQAGRTLGLDTCSAVLLLTPVLNWLALLAGTTAADPSLSTMLLRALGGWAAVGLGLVLVAFLLTTGSSVAPDKNRPAA